MFKTQKSIKVMVAALLFAGVFAIAGHVVPVSAIENGCGEVETSIIKCNPDTSKQGVEGSAIWALLLMIINILTAGVGVLALGGIVYGAIVFTSAGGSAEQIKKARTIFTNVAVGVIAFAAMYAVLNFLIPGGVF